MTLRFNDDGSFPYTRDERGKPVVDPEIVAILEGGGLPDQWSATQAGQVTATADDISEAVLTIDVPAGSEDTGDLVLWVRGEQDNNILTLDPYGALVIGGAVVDSTNGGASLIIRNGVGTSKFRFVANDGSGGQGVPKAAFFGSNAVAQPAAIADATDAGSAITQLNLVLAALRALGLIAS